MRSLHCGKAGDHERHAYRTSQGWWYCCGLEDHRLGPKPVKKAK